MTTLRPRRLAALALLASLAACGDDRHAPHAGTAEDPWLIGVSLCNTTDPWHKKLNSDIAHAAKGKDHLKLIFKDAGNKNSTQQAHVADLVAKDVDVLIISPREAGPCDKAVRAAHRKGIRVVILGREVGIPDFDAFIGCDNMKLGRAAGTWVRNQLEGKGRIVELMGNMQSPEAQARHRGFLQGLDLAAHPDLEIVHSAETDWSEASARKAMASTFVTIDGINVVFAHDDAGAHGAFLAAQADGLENTIKFVGIGALPKAGIERVSLGTQDATFLYPTGGAKAVEVAERLMEGEFPSDKYVWLDTRVYDADTVESGGAPIK